MENTAGFKTTQHYAQEVAKLEGFSQSLNSLFATQQQAGVSAVRLRSAELYVRASVDGQGGRFDVVDSTTEKEAGVCNFNAGRLPLNEGFIPNQVSVLFAGDGADATSPGAQNYGETDPPAVLKNSDLVIRQRGREIYRASIGSITNPHATEALSQKDNVSDLLSLFFMADDDPMTWSIECPKGETFTEGSSNDYPYVEIKFLGHQTEKRSI